MLHYHNMPEVPPIPQGWVLLGKGGEFENPSQMFFYGRIWCAEEENWGEETDWQGIAINTFYIARANSEIVRFNIPN